MGGVAATITGLKIIESKEQQKDNPYSAAKPSMATYSEIFTNIMDTNKILIDKADLDPRVFLSDQLKSDVDSRKILKQARFNPDSGTQMADLCSAYHFGVKAAMSQAVSDGKTLNLNPFQRDGYSDDLVASSMKSYLEGKGYSMSATSAISLSDIGKSALSAIKEIQVERHARRSMETSLSL